MEKRYVIYRKIDPKNSDFEYEEIRCGGKYFYFYSWDGMGYKCHSSVNMGKIFNDREEVIETYKALKKHPIGKKYDWKINLLPNNLVMYAGKQMDIEEKNTLRWLDLKI